MALIVNQSSTLGKALHYNVIQFSYRSVKNTTLK